MQPSGTIRYADKSIYRTHVPVAAVLVLNTPDDGRLRPKHVEWSCRNKTCTVLHQVGVSFDLMSYTIYILQYFVTRACLSRQATVEIL